MPPSRSGALLPLDPRHHSALDAEHPAVVDLEDEAARAAALPHEVEATGRADVDRALAARVEAPGPSEPGRFRADRHPGRCTRSRATWSCGPRRRRAPA